MLAIGLSNRRFRAKRGNSKEGLVSGCDAANLLLEFSAGAYKRLRLFPEQTEGGQAAAVRKDCERGYNFVFWPDCVIFMANVFYDEKVYFFVGGIVWVGVGSYGKGPGA